MRHWAVVLAIQGVAAHARAAESPPAPSTGAAVALSWIRAPDAESCASPKQVAARVDAVLGRSAFVSPAAAELFIEARVAPRQPSGTGFEVHISVKAADEAVIGVRDLVSAASSCAEIEASAALAIALLIDPEAGSADRAATPPPPTPAPSAPPPTPAPSAPAVTPPAAASPPAQPSQASFWRARVAVGALGAVGQLPGAALGVRGAVGLSPVERRAGVELSGLYLPAQRAELSESSGADIAARAFAAGGWWAPYRSGECAVSLLAGAQIGQLSASGFGFAPNRMATSLLLNGEVSTELSWGSRTWSGFARLGLAVPLWRDTFEGTRTSGTEPIFHPSAVIGSLWLGIGLSP